MGTTHDEMIETTREELAALYAAMLNDADFDELLRCPDFRDDLTDLRVKAELLHREFRVLVEERKGPK